MTASAAWLFRRGAQVGVTDRKKLGRSQLDTCRGRRRKSGRCSVKRQLAPGGVSLAVGTVHVEAPCRLTDEGRRTMPTRRIPARLGVGERRQVVCRR